MAKRPSTPSELREAVERTVQATLGSAERQRDRTQGAIDDIAGTVDNLRRGAEASLARGRRVLEDRRPATYDDLRELKAELRRIGRRLDEIEERLPAQRSGSAAKRSGSSSAKRSGSSSAKRSGSSSAKRSGSSAAKRSGSSSAKGSGSSPAKRSGSSAAKRKPPSS